MRLATRFHQTGSMYYAAVRGLGEAVPPVVRLLADPVRWRLARELAGGDRRVRELVAALGQPQNLLSYHLRQLRDGGLVTARRSSFDGRDTYYRLDLPACAQALAGAAAALHPGLTAVPGAASGPPVRGERALPRVLFVCTGNSSRSPMAEALLRYRGGPRARSASAGVTPRPLHPLAAAVMRDRYQIDISAHAPVLAAAIAGQRFDYVISLCDKAREALPGFAGRPSRMHWSMPDPAAGDDGLTGYPAFERAAAELDTRIGFLLPVLDRAAADRV